MSPTTAPKPLPATHVACRCGRAYSPAAWATLSLALRRDDGVGGRLELRSCGCGRTLAIPLPPLPALPPLAKCMPCGDYQLPPANAQSAPLAACMPCGEYALPAVRAQKGGAS